MGRSAYGIRGENVRPCAIVAYEGTSGSGLYSVRQVADRLAVHPETIRRLIHDGRLEAVRVGRVLRVHGSELERFLARQRVKPQRSR